MADNMEVNFSYMGHLRIHKYQNMFQETYNYYAVVLRIYELFFASCIFVSVNGNICSGLDHES